MHTISNYNTLFKPSETGYKTTIRASARRLARRMSKRRKARQLLELDDRMLNDIGFERHDIEFALSKWGQNPTVILTNIRRQRQAGLQI